jgi:hypothetical protein
LHQRDKTPDSGFVRVDYSSVKSYELRTGYTISRSVIASVEDLGGDKIESKPN